MPRVLEQEQHSSCSDLNVIEVFSYPETSRKVKVRSGGTSLDDFDEIDIRFPKLQKRFS